MLPGKKGIPEYVYAYAVKNSLSVGCFLSREDFAVIANEEKYRKNFIFEPFLSSGNCEEWNLSGIKKSFETLKNGLSRGVFLSARPGKKEKRLLEEHSFLYAVNNGFSSAARISTEPYAQQNSAINGEYNSEQLENFCKSDPYGGVFGCFSILLDENLTEEIWFEKVLPLLERLNEAAIVCLDDERICEYMLSLKSLRVSVDSTVAENISAEDLYLIVNGKELLLAPGEKLFIRRKNLQGESCASTSLSPEEKWDFEVRKKEKKLFSNRNVENFSDGTLFFPGGCRKALSFSYDDGNKQDKDLIRILDKYGMKGTFNLNSAGVLDSMKVFGEEWDIKIYAGHEVAGHGLYHHSFAAHTPSHVATCLYMDRLILESFLNDILCGHAYSNGTYSGAATYARELLAANRYIYARGAASTANFDLPEDFFIWEQTCHHNMGILALADRFLQESEEGDLKAFTVWGHVSELVRDNAFDMMDEFCCKLSGKEKYIWYATNKEICEYVLASRCLIWSEDRSMVKNPSSITLFMAVDGFLTELAPGKTLSLKK